MRIRDWSSDVCSSDLPGAELVPGMVTAVVDDGHTPGHSAYLVTSGNERLLYIGDTVHHFVVSVQRPEWTIAYDMDAPLAEKRRRELLQRAADEATRVYAVHFPFPGLGRFEARDGNCVWVPETRSCARAISEHSKTAVWGQGV